MEENLRHQHRTIKIGVSGAASTEFLKQEDLDLVEKIGKEIAHQGAICVTGATTGDPLWAAKGAKEAGGISVGLSPAMSEREHVEVWNLPLDYTDFIVYVGGGYPIRDVMLVRSCDGLILGAGRVGTIHEFTVAFEENKPIGVLTSDDWETDDIIKLIVEKSHRADDNKKIIYDSDPQKLVKRLVELIKIDKAEIPSS